MAGWRWGWWLCALLACGEPSEPAEPEALAAGSPAERAMVRALLDDIEDDHQLADIGDDDVRQLWESRVAGQPLPARVPLEEVEDELRQELLQRARLGALVERVGELERTHGVERDQQAIEGLATLPLRFEEGP